VSVLAWIRNSRTERALATLVDGMVTHSILSVCVSVDQKLQDGTRIGNLGRWNGNSFNPRFAPGRYFGFSYPSTEVLHGDTNIVSNQKYQSWVLQSTQDPDVKNHHEFDIADASFVSLLTSQFNPTQNNITIRTGWWTTCLEILPPKERAMGRH